MKPSGLPLRRLLVFVMAVALLPAYTGCVQLAEVDATAAPRYRPMLGREFELKEDLLARGVKLPPRFEAVNYILLMPPPGIGSRYRIVDLGRVPAGSRFRIVGVVTHRSTLFPLTEYVVAFTNQRLEGADDIPIRLSAAAGWKLYTPSASSDAAPELNERYFRPVPDLPGRPRK